MTLYLDKLQIRHCQTPLTAVHNSDQSASKLHLDIVKSIWFVSSLSSNWPVFGIEMDFGSVSSTPAPAVWTLGMVRDPAVQYTNNGQNELRSSYYISAFDSIDDAVSNSQLIATVWCIDY